MASSTEKLDFFDVITTVLGDDGRYVVANGYPKV